MGMAIVERTEEIEEEKEECKSEIAPQPSHSTITAQSGKFVTSSLLPRPENSRSEIGRGQDPTYTYTRRPRQPCMNSILWMRRQGARPIGQGGSTGRIKRVVELMVPQYCSYEHIQRSTCVMQHADRCRGKGQDPI